MPENGLYWSGEIAYRVSASGAAGHTGTLPGPFLYSFGGKVESYWADSYLTTKVGVSLAIQETGGNRVLEASIPDIGFSYSSTTSPGTLSAEIRLGVKVYVNGTGVFRTEITSVEVYRAGTMVHSASGGVVNSVIQPMAGAIPVIGIPPKLTAIGGAAPLPVQGEVGAAFSVSANAMCTGGWRWKESGDSDWKTLPFDCSDQDSGLPTIGGTDTWSVEVRTEQESSRTTTSGLDRNKGCFAWIFPNSPRSIHRINDDYASLVFRWGMPRTRMNSQTTLGYPNVVPPPGDPPLYVVTNTLSTLLAAQSQFLAEMENSTHSIEDTLTTRLNAPFFQSASDVTWGDGLSTVYVDGAQRSYPAEVTNLGGASACLPATTGHASIVVNLLNSWFSPHWSFCHWFQDWEIDGGAVSCKDYWMPARSQHRKNAGLPSGGSKKRNILVSAPLESSGLLGLQDETLGENLRWLGISRFQIQSQDCLSSLTLSPSHASRFTVTEGIVDFSSASGIKIQSSKAVFEFDLLSFTSSPYLTLAYAKRVLLGWDSRIASVKAFLVGQDASKVLIGGTEGWHDLVSGDSRKFAGTWGLDQGFGEITDQGTDGDSASSVAINKPGRGVSAATFSDSEKLIDSALLVARAGTKLKFIAELASGETEGLLDWLQFEFHDGSPNLAFWETGQANTSVFADGPAIRFGNFDFWSLVTGFMNPPSVTKVPFASTVIDWLCAKRLLLRNESFTGGSPALTTELTALYDSYEVNSVAAVERNSLAFLLPSSLNSMVAALVNTVAELPPSPACPTSERGSDWQKSGDLELGVYDLSSATRTMISAGRQLRWHDGTSFVGSSLTAPAGWFAWQANPALTGSESWTIRDFGGLIWAKTVRPWWSRFAVVGEAILNLSANTLDVDRLSVLHAFCRIQSGTIRVGVAGNELTYVFRDTGIAADWAKVSIDKWSSAQTIVLVYEKDGEVKQVISTDRGYTWSVADSISTGTKPMVLIGMNGTRHLYWADDTTIKGQLRSRDNVVIEPTFSVTTGVDEGETFDAVEDVTTKGEKRVHLVCVKGGTVTTLESTDGKTFS